MSKLCCMSENGSLKNFIYGFLGLIETQAECCVAHFNIVLEDNNGHCVISLAKEREEE